MNSAKPIGLGTAPVGRLVAKLAAPAVVAQIINLLYNLVDRMYVGRIPQIGTDALAGLGVALPITLILSAFSNLVGMGGAPLASIYMGEKKKAGAERVFNNGAVLLVIFGIVLTVAVLTSGEALLHLFGAPQSSFEYAYEYLFVYGTGTIFVMLSLGLNPFITAQGYSFTSMATVAIGAVLNIALDPLFIFTFNMGVRGGGAGNRHLTGRVGGVGGGFFHAQKIADALQTVYVRALAAGCGQNVAARAFAVHDVGR